MGDNSATKVTNQRLDSWKEIAAFFGRDERTVRRWEKERALPVHRVPGGERGSIFAYAAELREWLKIRAGELDSIASGSSQALAESSAAPAQALGQRSSSASAQPSFTSVAIWLAPLLVVVAVIVAFSFSHRETRYRNAMAAPHAPSADAQELYLKGEYHWAKRTPEDLNKAVDFFTQSIVKDPSYAQAYVGLANCYNLLREFSIMPPDEAYPRALAAAQKAVELDPTSAGAHSSWPSPRFTGIGRPRPPNANTSARWNWTRISCRRITGMRHFC